MARRVGGWQRIGILLSVAWAIAGPLYLNDRVYNNALEEYGLTYHLCREAQGVADFDPARCTERADAMQKNRDAKFRADWLIWLGIRGNRPRGVGVDTRLRYRWLVAMDTSGI